VSKLDVAYHACVYSTNNRSECKSCETICPTDAIKMDERMPTFMPSLCVGCGGCVGACPTEAFSTDGFVPEEFTRTFLADNESIISCKTNIACIGALNSEYLISYALQKRENITLDLGYCEGCEWAHSLKPHIDRSIEEANYFLVSAGEEMRITPKELKLGSEPVLEEQLSRRELFSRATLKGALKTKKGFDERVDEAEGVYTKADYKGFDRAKVKEKSIPFRRQFFIDSTRVLAPANFTVENLVYEKLTFITDKVIDKKACINCAICYNICPTGSLHGDLMKGKIEFDFLYCVACGSCHDSCLYDALDKEEEFSILGFVEPKRKKLAKFLMRNCGDCGVFFKYDGDDFCPRCRDLDDESRELVGF
jgi:energy-converting hydrogenase A subunit P